MIYSMSTLDIRIAVDIRIVSALLYALITLAKYGNQLNGTIVQSKLDIRTLDIRIPVSLVIRIFLLLTKIKFAHKSTRYKNNA